MYNELLEYAKREGLKIETDFEPKKISWILQLDKNGNVVGPLIHNVKEVLLDTGKAKNVIKTLNVPYTDPRDLNRKPKEYYFLYGTPNIMFGVDDSNSSVEKCNFVKKLLLENSANPHFKSLYSFLANPLQLDIVKEMVDKQKANDDWITFLIDGTLLVNNPTIINFWRKYRTDNSRINTIPRLCMVSGETKVCLDDFTKMTIPKLGSASLSGLGQPAFTHYGIAGISIGVEEDSLIRAALYDLGEKGIYQSGVNYISWTKGKTNDPDLINLLEFTDEEAVKKLINSIKSGEQEEILDTNVYYLFGLSVNSGRLVVTEQHSIPLSVVQDNVKKWFSKMGEKKYTLYQLTKSLESKSDGKGAKKHIWTNYYRQLMNCALFDKPIPKEILNRIFDLESVSILKDVPPNGARTALLKLGIEFSANSSSTVLGNVFGKYSNLHRLTGCEKNNYVLSMLNNIINRPKYSYEMLKKRFTDLEIFYTRKANDKFPGRGTQLYNELMEITINVPQRFRSIEEKIEFLVSFNQTTH